MRSALARGIELVFSPSSPVAIYRRPRRFAANAVAVAVNCWLRLLDWLWPRENVVCSVCGWRGRRFGAMAAVSVDYFATDELCLRCGANRRTRVVLEVFEGIVGSDEECLVIVEVGPSRSTRHYFWRHPAWHYVAVDRFVGADLCSDATSIALADNSIDVVICCHVLEHIEDYGRAIEEFHRILKPGCFGIILVPQSPYTFRSRRISSRAIRGYGHCWEFGGDFADKLGQGGFHVSTLHRFIHSSTFEEPVHIVSKA